MKQYIATEFADGYKLAKEDIEIWGIDLAKSLVRHLYDGTDWFAAGYRNAVESAK